MTSSYLEGEQGHFGEYGYNRDGKKGKKQIVIGLLCDEQGEAVSTEVFTGNTQDTQTFVPQVRKVAERFGCKEVTIVGDRGMIKTLQIGQLPEGFHYITAITKPQIEALINKGILQLGLFEDKLCEVKENGVRYILMRNPVSAEEMAESRLSKMRSFGEFIEKKNSYLRDHPGASVSKALEKAKEKLKILRKAWDGFDLTVEGGLEQLATVCSMEVKVKGQDTRCLKIPHHENNLVDC